MSRQFGRVASGHQADEAIGESASFDIGFFQKGVRFTFPSSEKQVQGRILPARDQNLSEADAAYPTSVVPYRDPAVFDKTTGQPAFTGWFNVIRGYRFFGRQRVRLISPSTLLALGAGVTPEDTADPILDCLSLAKQSDNPTWRALLEKGPNAKRNDKAPLRFPDKYAILNTWLPYKDKWENSVTVVAYAALENLKKKLAWPTTYGSEPLDAQWPQFLFGDITNPKTGLLATLHSIRLENITVNGFDFSSQEFQLSGHRIMPVDDGVLRGRADLATDKTLKILTYQEIVEFLVQDGALPRDLVAAACSGMANVPGGSAPASYHPAPAQPQSQQAAPARSAQPDLNEQLPFDGAPPVAPTPPAPPAPPAAPAAPQTSAEPYYWVIYSPAQNGVAARIPESELRTLVAAGATGANVMSDDKTSGWKVPADFGIVPIAAAPVAPTPPVAPTAPPAPPVAPTAPPSAPAGFPAPVTDLPPGPSATSLPVPDADPNWSAEDEANYNSLRELLATRQLGPERLPELVRLGNRRGNRP